MRKSPKVVFLAVGGTTAALAMGLGIGVAVAQVPSLFAPAGVTADRGVPVTPMSKPEYPKNSRGLTYGSAAIADRPENEPDLIRVISDSGREGYVKKTDLDDANGTTAAKSFRSPEDALKWQATEGSKNHPIPVYDVSGETRLDTFTVVAPKR